MKIAVTGGNGDLGSSLIPYLLQQGHAVVSIDRAFPTNQTYSPDPLEHLVADTTNFGQFVSCIQGCDALIHLAAHRSPAGYPDWVVYNENTAGSYNALSAAVTVGIKRVCLASSINAIGGAFSRTPRYDYFPVDEQHTTYAEDPYSLSKWVLEQQADAFARRYEDMSIASLRFHWLVPGYERGAELTQRATNIAARHLWAYTALPAASEACLLAVTAPFTGHEAFYITAPQTAASAPSAELAHAYYPEVPVRGELAGHSSFFTCAKAERILGWQHRDEQYANH